MMKKHYDDDDGRTIADMSSIQRTPLIVPNPGAARQDIGRAEKDADMVEKSEDERRQKQLSQQLSKSERRSFILGATGAAALIAGVFIAAGGAVIALILALWG